MRRATYITAGAALAAGALLCVVPARSVRASTCAPYIVVEVHGSSAPANVPSTPDLQFYEALQADLKPQKVKLIVAPFPAAGGVGTMIGAFFRLPLAYYKSVVKMKQWLNDVVMPNLTSQCPATRIFLVGYSQGAQAAADVFQERWWPYISGLVLFGDPEFNPNDHSDWFGGNAKSQLRYTLNNGVLGERPPFETAKVESFCHRGDPVCQGWDKLIHLSTQHKNYDRFGEPQMAAESFAQKIAGSWRFAGWPVTRHDLPLDFRLYSEYWRYDVLWSSCSKEHCVYARSDGQVWLVPLNWGPAIMAVDEESLNGAGTPTELLEGWGVPATETQKLLSQR